MARRHCILNASNVPRAPVNSTGALTLIPEVSPAGAVVTEDGCGAMSDSIWKLSTHWVTVSMVDVCSLGVGSDPLSEGVSSLEVASLLVIDRSSSSDINRFT